MPQEIKQARKKLKLKQSELAPLLGVSVRTIQEYEQGRMAPGKSVLMLLDNLIKKGNNHG